MAHEILHQKSVPPYTCIKKNNKVQLVENKLIFDLFCYRPFLNESVVHDVAFFLIMKLTQMNISATLIDLDI